MSSDGVLMGRRCLDAGLFDGLSNAGISGDGIASIFTKSYQSVNLHQTIILIYF